MSTLKKMKKKTKIRKAKARLDSFDVDGNCPICCPKRPFKDDSCPHTIGKAKGYLQAQYFRAIKEPVQVKDFDKVRKAAVDKVTSNLVFYLEEAGVKHESLERDLQKSIESLVDSIVYLCSDGE